MGNRELGFCSICGKVHKSKDEARWDTGHLPEQADRYPTWNLGDHTNNIRRINKPWGYELLWAESDKYVGKILHVDKGESLSLQYHEVKDETLFVYNGEIKLLVGIDENNLDEVKVGKWFSIHIEPGTIHRITAITDCDIFEVSTPELDDVVRLKDIYGRDEK